MQQGDLYTTHLNRRYRKRVLVNAGIGLAFAALCGNAFLSAAGAGIMALIGMILGIVVFLFLVANVVGARRPLRLTENGIVARYSFLAEVRLPWPEIAGLGIYPRRHDPCLLWRRNPHAEPEPFVIGWTMIDENQEEVIGRIKAQLGRYGHVFEEEREPEPSSEPKLINPLKDFWN